MSKKRKIKNWGWIKMHRKVKNHPVFQDAYLFHLFCYYLLSVNWAEKRSLWNGNELVVRAGEGIFGLHQTVKDLTGLKNPKTAKFKKFCAIYYRRMQILKNISVVVKRTTNCFTFIRVINWHKYQLSEKRVKNERKTSEKRVLTSKELIKNLKRNNKEIIKRRASSREKPFQKAKQKLIKKLSIKKIKT